MLKDANLARCIFKSYRPISITSMCSRLAERGVARLLLAELSRDGVIRDNQFGGRRGRGADEALSYFCMSTRDVVRADGECHCIFLDIAKAFDRVQPLLLVHKLRGYGVSEVLLLWIYRFLTGRRHRVSVGSDTSDWVESSVGIPQGTVLGPILFSVFINDSSRLINL